MENLQKENMYLRELHDKNLEIMQLEQDKITIKEEISKSHKLSDERYEKMNQLQAELSEKNKVIEEMTNISHAVRFIIEDECVDLDVQKKLLDKIETCHIMLENQDGRLQ